MPYVVGSTVVVESGPFANGEFGGGYDIQAVGVPNGDYVIAYGSNLAEYGPTNSFVASSSYPEPVYAAALAVSPQSSSYLVTISDTPDEGEYYLGTGLQSGLGGIGGGAGFGQELALTASPVQMFDIVGLGDGQYAALWSYANEVELYSGDFQSGGDVSLGSGSWTQDLGQPSVVQLSNGNLVAAWPGSSGNELSVVNDTTKAITSNQSFGGAQDIGAPELTALPNGDFVVAWNADGTLEDQLYTSTGAAIGNVNIIDTSVDGAPAIATLANGDFVVSWAEVNQRTGDGDNDSVVGQVFNEAGATVESAFVAANAWASNPTIASLSDGNFAVSWVIDNPTSGEVEIQSQVYSLTATTNPALSAGTTADMIMGEPSNGSYEIYDIGSNKILAAYSLGQISTSLTFVGLGTFQSGDTSDMLLRNDSTGAFYAYYVDGNNVTSSALVGTVGMNWNFAGTGDFDGGSSLSELLLRNTSTNGFELYHVAGGGVLSGNSVAAIGNNMQISGFGNFSEPSTTQMLMEDTSFGGGNTDAGELWLYTYNSAASAFSGAAIGNIGPNLTALGCADLLGNGSTQLLEQQNNGTLWLYTYNPANGVLTGQDVGAIGSNFHEVGFGPLGTSGQDEMLMQDAAGDFEVYQYNAGLNAFVGNSMGAVGAPWVVDGIAANSPATGASTTQLVQAMASMSNGASISTPINSTAHLETTTPTLLTAPQQV